MRLAYVASEAMKLHPAIVDICAHREIGACFFDRLVVKITDDNESGARSAITDAWQRCAPSNYPYPTGL